VTRLLDFLARPEIRVFGRAHSAFLVCGQSGLALAIGVGVSLTLYRGLSVWVLLAVVLTAVVTFLALAMITKIVLREEQLIYYHHEVAILCTVTVLLVLMREPVLPYLDVTILGVGTFLFCGRVGCFMVGCCHGRRHRWGVRYRPEHAEAGFTPYYVGVRLFPIQLVESLWVLATVAAGIGLVLDGAAPGVALAWYVIVYDVGRFCFEFTRGDPARPYRGGFSEGQWTSLLLMLVVTGAELAGAVPPHTWHLIATAGVAAAMVTVTARRHLRGDSRYRLLNPNHVDELADAMNDIAKSRSDNPGPIEVTTTSAGLRISTGQAGTARGAVRHYTFSTSGHPLSGADARAVAGVITVLGHHAEFGDLLPGRAGTFHLLLPLSTSSRVEEASAR
jgi:hypothetical protein